MIFFLSADSFLGKVDKHSLSQETLLELLVEGFTTNKEKICGPEENIKDASEWKGVIFNDRNTVDEINWPYLDLEGSIELKWLPLSTKKCLLQWNRLTGTVDLTCLPATLDALSLSGNRFHGTIDLTHLPGGLKSLFLYENNFFGKTDFSQLPESLQQLNIDGTKIEGEIFHFSGYLSVAGSNVRVLRK